MLKILLGTDWIANRDAVLENIARDVKAKQGNRILIVPELISHDMERRLCAHAGDTSSRYAEVLSFTRLARRVKDMVGHSAQECLDNGGRVVAMAAASRNMHSRLKAYASVETKPEFLSGLVDAVDEFKRCCITAADLKAASEASEGTLAQKLEELSLLLEAYDSFCARGKRDPRDQMNWLLEQLEESSFGADHVFYIDGFPDLTRQHMAILEHLVRVSPCVTVSLNCDSVDSSNLAFEKAGQTASQIIRLAKKHEIPVEISRVKPRENVLAPLCRNLFQGKIEQDQMLASRVHAFRCESPYMECENVAGYILEQVRNGCRFRDFSVVCADPGGYQNVASYVLRRAGIPVYESGKEDILQKSVMATVLAALEAALGGMEQEDVLRYLKSALSPLEPDTTDKLENYVILWGIRGKRWAETWQYHPGGLGEEWDEKSRTELFQINQAAEQAVKPLMTLQKAFQKSHLLSDQIRAIYEFLDTIQMAQRLENLADELDAAGDNRNAQILNQLWEILLSAMEQMHDVLGNTSWESEGFLRLFSLLLSQYDVGTIPPVLDAVMIGPVNAMRCQQVKHLLVLGASEGCLPGYGGSSGILTDQERVALRQMGVPLTGGAMEGLQAEFSEIYGVFCGASESVCISYSSGQSSFVYRRLAQMAGGEQEPNTAAYALASSESGAVSYLARFGAQDVARELGIEEGYLRMKHRSEYALGDLSRQQVRGLYGSSLKLSASQVDVQAQCRLSYFLKYGLRLKERKEATVDPAEFGTYVHAVLEKTAKRVMSTGGFHQVDLAQTMDIAREYAAEYAAERFSQLDSLRSTYLFERNGQELEMVVRELWEELHISRFEPSGFEVGFGEDKTLPAIRIDGAKMEAIVLGFVDRVDSWKELGQNYFRIVDYKTGKKEIDYCDMFNGIGLQMLLYLFALANGGEAVLGAHPAAAGIQYFPARAPMISGDSKLTEEEMEKLRSKLWKRSGLLLADDAVLEAMEPEGALGRLCCKKNKDGELYGDIASREQLKMLETYVFKILGTIVDEIADGKVDPNPYSRGTSHNACTYCPFGAVCGKAEVTGRRNYKTMSSQRFWEEIGKELGRNG